MYVAGWLAKNLSPNKYEVLFFLPGLPLYVTRWVMTDLEYEVTFMNYLLDPLTLGELGKYRNKNTGSKGLLLEEPGESLLLYQFQWGKGLLISGNGSFHLTAGAESEGI